MQNVLNSVKTFLVEEDGPTAVEYAVMLALIIIVCLAAIKSVGTTANDRFTDVKNALTPARRRLRKAPDDHGSSDRLQRPAPATEAVRWLPAGYD